MKFSKLIASVSVLVLGAALLNSAPANAACYWQRTGNGDEQILVIDSTGQCTLDLGTPVVDPNTGSTPTPSAPSTPMPSATATPVTEATPTPAETSAPSPSTVPTAEPNKSETMVTHAVSGRLDLINFGIKRVQLTDVQDPSNSVACYWTAYCAISMPISHSWRYSIISDTPVIALISSRPIQESPVRLSLVRGEYLSAGELRATDTDILYLHQTTPLVLISRAFEEQKLTFGAFGETALETLKLRQGEFVTITQRAVTENRIQWSNLPLGLELASDGTISGRPITPGTYVVTAPRLGTKSKLSFTIEVEPGVSIPKNMRVTSAGLTAASYSFEVDTKTSVDFFEIEVKNLRTNQVEKKYLDGGANSGSLKDLLPGDAYQIRVRSGTASPLTYSDFSSPVILKAQKAPKYFAVANNSASVTQTWATGSANKFLITISKSIPGDVQLEFSRSKLNVTKAQRDAFNAYFAGLDLRFDRTTGYITGPVRKGDVAKKPLTIKLGVYEFEFDFGTAK